MKTIRGLLHLLVHLSNADNEFAKEELKYIIEIGINNGLNRKEVEELLSNPGEFPDLNNLDSKERLSYLINMIQVIKVDGKVRRSEIDFCEKVALKLGYLPGVVSKMSQHVYSDSMMIRYDKLEQIAKENSTKP